MLAKIKNDKIRWTARADKMDKTDDVEIADGSEDEEGIDLMDMIEHDRSLDEERALVDPQVIFLSTRSRTRTDTTPTDASVSASV